MTQSLITRLRDAEGADRELDAEIAVHFRWENDEGCEAYSVHNTRDGKTLIEMMGDNDLDYLMPPPPLTASLDAALDLLWETIRPLTYSVRQTIKKAEPIPHSAGKAHIWPPGQTWHYASIEISPTRRFTGDHKSPAIALLIALLHAQGAQDA